MRKILTLTLLLLAFACVVNPLQAKKKKEDKNLTIPELIAKIDWKKPSTTGIGRLDNLNTKCDRLFSTVKVMGDSLPVYSLKSIVKDGDTTAILVVDQNNMPYNSTQAKLEMARGGAYLISLLAYTAPLSTEYIGLVKELPAMVKSDPISAAMLISGATKASHKLIKLKDLLPTIQYTYKNLSNPIQEYCKAQASLSKEDGFLTTGFDHVPVIPEDQIPSDEELDRLLEMEREARGN